MPPLFQFEFSYLIQPTIWVKVVAPDTGASRVISTLLDTGADVSLLDSLIAERLGISLASRETISVEGVGGTKLEARLAQVELRLLDEEELAIRLPVAFAPAQATTIGNLLGLDVLSYFDFGLSHRARVGYLGRSR